MATATPYKVAVKLGQAEFSAEGPEETVKEQLAHFFIAATQPLSPQIKGNGNGTVHGNGHANGNGGHGAPAPEAEHTSVNQAIIDRLFKEDRDGILSLRTLPKTDDRNADALLLILWG